MTYIKENKSDFRGCYPKNVEHAIKKLQNLCSLPRNFRAGIELPAPFLVKPLCASNLLPACKICIEKPAARFLVVYNHLQICRICRSSAYHHNFKENIITKLQKLYSLPRNFSEGNN